VAVKPFNANSLVAEAANAGGRSQIGSFEQSIKLRPQVDAGKMSNEQEIPVQLFVTQVAVEQLDDVRNVVAVNGDVMTATINILFIDDVITVDVTDTNVATDSRVIVDVSVFVLDVYVVIVVNIIIHQRPTL